MYDNTTTAEQFSKTIVANYRKLPPREQAHETTQLASQLRTGRFCNRLTIQCNTIQYNN